jgi:hypothetical protein
MNGIFYLVSLMLVGVFVLAAFWREPGARTISTVRERTNKSASRPRWRGAAAVTSGW